MIVFEEGEFGKKAILAAPWSRSVHEKIMRVRPDELELNTSKGWLGADIGFVSDFQWLKSITVIDMKINDVSPVMYLQNLISLDIVTYCKTKFDFSRFPFLRKCSLEWRRGAESIFDCSGLVYLFVNRYNGKSSAPFRNLVNLNSLAIMNSPISDLHFLTALHHLQLLRIGGLRALKSLDGIEGLCRLESFEMQNCRSIKSLAPLSYLNTLVEVNLSNNGVLDSLGPLAALTALRTVLFYEATNISDGDLTPIFNNRNISKVAFQNRRHYSHNREDFMQRDRVNNGGTEI